VCDTIFGRPHARVIRELQWTVDKEKLTVMRNAADCLARSRVYSVSDLHTLRIESSTLLDSGGSESERGALGCWDRV